MGPLSFFFGTIVGVSLGLTGGGGAIFAVPLLVYGLGTPPREAVGISLAAVGSTSFVGFLHRWKLGEVEFRTGLLFAIAGMIGAPVGTWMARFIPDAWLLVAFAALMVIVAARLWKQASRSVPPRAQCAPLEATGGPTCRRDTSGSLVLTSRCALLLVMAGILTGVLSGLFGVGGGFVIVPALVLFSGMAIHRAIGTSLMVIALVSVTGIASHIWAGQSISTNIAVSFVVGGIAGLFTGQRISRNLPDPLLQRAFAVVILAVAVFVAVRHLQF